MNIVKSQAAPFTFLSLITKERKPTESNGLRSFSFHLSVIGGNEITTRNSSLDVGIITYVSAAVRNNQWD